MIYGIMAPQAQSKSVAKQDTRHAGDCKHWVKKSIRNCLIPAYFGGEIAGIYSYTEAVCCSWTGCYSAIGGTGHLLFKESTMKKFAIGGLLVVLAIFCGSAVWAQSVTAGDIRKGHGNQYGQWRLPCDFGE
jgi:hypothetical protein